MLSNGRMLRALTTPPVASSSSSSLLELGGCSFCAGTALRSSVVSTTRFGSVRTQHTERPNELLEYTAITGHRRMTTPTWPKFIGIAELPARTARGGQRRVRCLVTLRRQAPRVSLPVLGCRGDRSLLVLAAGGIPVVSGCGVGGSPCQCLGGLNWDAGDTSLRQAPRVSLPVLGCRGDRSLLVLAAGGIPVVSGCGVGGSPCQCLGGLNWDAGDTSLRQAPRVSLPVLGCRGDRSLLVLAAGGIPVVSGCGVGGSPCQCLGGLNWDAGDTSLRQAPRVSLPVLGCRGDRSLLVLAAGGIPVVSGCGVGGSPCQCLAGQNWDAGGASLRPSRGISTVEEDLSWPCSKLHHRHVTRSKTI